MSTKLFFNSDIICCVSLLVQRLGQRPNFSALEFKQTDLILNQRPEPYNHFFTHLKINQTQPCRLYYQTLTDRTQFMAIQKKNKRSPGNELGRGRRWLTKHCPHDRCRVSITASGSLLMSCPPALRRLQRPPAGHASLCLCLLYDRSRKETQSFTPSVSSPLLYLTETEEGACRGGITLH